MAKVYNTRNILDSNMLLNAKQFSREREKTLAGYRKEMAEGLGQLAKAMGSGFDMYRRYSEIKDDGYSNVQDIENQIKELEAELSKVNEEIRSKESTTVPSGTLIDTNDVDTGSYYG